MATDWKETYLLRSTVVLFSGPQQNLADNHQNKESSLFWNFQRKLLKFLTFDPIKLLGKSDEPSSSKNKKFK